MTPTPKLPNPPEQSSEIDIPPALSGPILMTGGEHAIAVVPDCAVSGDTRPWWEAMYGPAVSESEFANTPTLTDDLTRALTSPRQTLTVENALYMDVAEAVLWHADGYAVDPTTSKCEEWEVCRACGEYDGDGGYTMGNGSVRHYPLGACDGFETMACEECDGRGWVPIIDTEETKK